MSLGEWNFKARSQPIVQNALSLYTVSPSSKEFSSKRSVWQKKEWAVQTGSKDIKWPKKPWCIPETWEMWSKENDSVQNYISFNISLQNAQLGIRWTTNERFWFKSYFYTNGTTGLLGHLEFQSSAKKMNRKRVWCLFLMIPFEQIQTQLIKYLGPD